MVDCAMIADDQRCEAEDRNGNRCVWPRHGRELRHRVRVMTLPAPARRDDGFDYEAAQWRARYRFEGR